MSLFSFLRKNKQESASDDSAFFSRAEEDSKAVRSRRRGRAEQTTPGDDPKDPILPEKKRARRRLIGAVALVLAAIIGLPMILDSQPKPVADDIAIQIPSKDKPVPPLRAYLSPEPNDPAASLDAKEEMLEPAEAGEPAKTKATPEKAVTPSEPAAKTTVEATAEPAKAADKSAATAPGAKHEIKAEAKPEPKVDAKAKAKAEEARAKALLEGKPDPKAADKKSTKYAIQVAALATKDKIDELQGKLKGGGIKSYTQKVATAAGDRTRIRVGPFDSKEEAEKVRAKIMKLGLNGTLVPV